MLGDCNPWRHSRLPFAEGCEAVANTGNTREAKGKVNDQAVLYALSPLLATLPEPHQGRVWPYRSIRNAFEAAVETAALDNFRFHDTRHHFASWFMMPGW
jgi:hypothetical protein